MLNISFSIPLNRPEKSVKPFFLMEILCGLVMYGMIFFFIMADIITFIYQQIYFRTYDIPMIKRSDYVKLQRHKLRKLNFFQKIACLYCDYCNGVIAWTKVVVNQTEVYSCAIKFPDPGYGKEHRENFKDHTLFT